MSQSLIIRIDAARTKVATAHRILDEETATLRNLENSRVDCAHIFSKPVLNYEHEGGYCTECGINELYAHTLRKLYAKL